jgi:hypothetical protein
MAKVQYAKRRPVKPLTDTGKRTEGQWHSFTMDAPGSHMCSSL